MKSTGIVRKVDSLGRIVIPVELRRLLNIDCKDPMELYIDEDIVIFKKYIPLCYLCGEGREMKRFKGKNICLSCVEHIKGLKTKDV